MPEFDTRVFGYAHSNAVMAGLKAHAKSRRLTITDAYAYIEEEGENTALYEMVKIAKLGGNDILYVDSVKEFAGDSLSDFKAALTAIENAGMKVVSLTEKHYDYAAFMTAIKVLEDLTPAYRKNSCRVAAVTMYRMKMDVKRIAAELDMSEADIHEAIASYKRSLEEAGLEEE